MDPKAISRFVSALAGAFRSFYIYNQDNKAFEEILQNLVKRFQETQATPQPVQLIITNRSLLYNGEPVGFPELTITLASVLRNLGYKSMQFRQPIQGRHFFQFLHILTGKDSNDSKNEKLINLLDSGEDKPVSLVAFAANSSIMRLSDDVIAKRLLPLGATRAQGGSGFAENFSQATIKTLPDLCVWVPSQLGAFESSTKTFVQTLLEGVQEGYFPWDRFLKVFPMPHDLRTNLHASLSCETMRHVRTPTPLGQRYLGTKIAPPNACNVVDWVSRMGSFSTDEVKSHQELRMTGASISASKDLDLAEALLKQSGANFTFGLALLLRTLSEKNSVAIQEKSLRLAADVWNASLGSEISPAAIGLMSGLRQHLSSLQNINLALFPLRTATVESSQFNDRLRYFLSLGKYCLAPLISALDSEQDRGMRKKICMVIAAVAREDGADVMIEALPNASPFLKRNLVMVLGDIRAAGAVAAIAPLLAHQQKIVRSEAVRALCRINNDDAQKALLPVALNSTDADLKMVATQVLSQTKYKNLIKAA